MERVVTSENTELFRKVQFFFIILFIILLLLFIFYYFDNKKFWQLAKLYANTVSLLSEGKDISSYMTWLRTYEQNMGKEKWEAKPEWLFCKKLAVLAQKKKLTIWKVFLFSIFDPKKRKCI